MSPSSISPQLYDPSAIEAGAVQFFPENEGQSNVYIGDIKCNCVWVRSDQMYTDGAKNATVHGLGAIKCIQMGQKMQLCMG